MLDIFTLLNLHIHISFWFSGIYAHHSRFFGKVHSGVSVKKSITVRGELGDIEKEDWSSIA